MRRVLVVAGVALGCLAAQGQWDIQESHTTASLRGIHSVDGKVAWASGSGGTVLRTVDGGKNWQVCAVPPGGEALDFRGVQAFDAQTAIVMSSGKGDLSRLYKTTDGCGTWRLVFTNPDAEGFWDGIVAHEGRAFIVGDPVEGRFVLYASRDGSFKTWERFGEKTNILQFPYNASANEALFAASNSVIEGDPSSNIAFITGGLSGSRFYLGLWNEQTAIGRIGAGYFEAELPLQKSPSGGAFSLGVRGDIAMRRQYVVVGGDYSRSDLTAGTAAYSLKGGVRWKPAKAFPHGYRSAVAYYAELKVWITVGPNGTDVSRDDGRNWMALKPAAGEPADADKNWNALSLPFVVGSKGRVGVLRAGVLALGGK